MANKDPLVHYPSEKPAWQHYFPVVVGLGVLAVNGLWLGGVIGDVAPAAVDGITIGFLFGAG